MRGRKVPHWHLHKNAQNGQKHFLERQNKELYGNLSSVAHVVRHRRMKLVGHVLRDKSSPAHMTITCQPTNGTANRGRPNATFVDTLLRDTNLELTADLENCMENRDIWRLLSDSRGISLDQK